MLMQKCAQLIAPWTNIIIKPVLIHQQRHYVRNAKRKRAERLVANTDFSWLEPLHEYQAGAEQRQAEQAKNEPHLLHVVKRTAPMKGRPWWEKEIMRQFGLYDPKAKSSQYRKCLTVVLKNIPSVNKKLNEVKHLVEILPLTFPHGMPQSEEDAKHSYLNCRGELLVKQQITPPLPASDAAQEESQRWELTKELVAKDCNYRKVNYKLHQEWHPPDYVHHFNQDGKELRYNFNKPEAIGRETHPCKAPKRRIQNYDRSYLDRAYR